MRALVLLAAMAGPAAAEDAVRPLLDAPAAHIEADLPRDMPLGVWLDHAMPETAPPLSPEPAPCGDARSRMCPALAAEVVSRDRSVRLVFAPAGDAFLRGEVTSPGSDATVTFTRLGDLPRALAEPLAPRPLACPGGTAATVRREYAGSFASCVDPAGRRDGPYRAWFSTGIYLMFKGDYANGAPAGVWTQCDRFERCRTWEVSPDDPVWPP